MSKSDTTTTEWSYISYDKNGLWTSRAPADDVMAGEINLDADWPDGIPVVSGQRIGTWTARETRHYSVQEIKNAQ